MKVYCIYDVVPDKIGSQLFVFDNDDMAKRAFKGLVANRLPNFESVYDNPGDYFVYCLGDIDLHGTGLIIATPAVRVCSLVDLRG